MTALILALALASIPIVRAPRDMATPPVVSPKVDTVKADAGGHK